MLVGEDERLDLIDPDVGHQKSLNHVAPAIDHHGRSIARERKHRGGPVRTGKSGAGPEQVQGSHQMHRQLQGMVLVTPHRAEVAQVVVESVRLDRAGVRGASW